MDITLAIKIFLMILSAVFTYFVIPYIKAKTTDSQLYNLKAFVRTGVRAAEMLYQEPGMGEVKKQYVLNYLSDLGYSVDVREIDTMIEGMVFELKQNLE